MVKNRTCQNCGNKFHACSSCGLLNEWEHRFCSCGCWIKSGEKQMITKIFNELISELSLQNKKNLLILLKYIDNHKYHFEDLLEKVIKHE